MGGVNPGVHLAPNPLEGLHPPVLATTGNLVTGSETDELQLQNRRQRHALRDTQLPTLMWTRNLGSAILPPAQAWPSAYRNKMCPVGIATAHPAGDLLAKWSQLGCPTRTGKPWLKQEMCVAGAWSPHQSSLTPEALAHFTEESIEKVQAGQAKLVMWDDMEDNPPAQLKILPIAAIPHKSKVFCSILDLSFRLQLKHGGFLNLVNNATVKLAPQGALDQLGHTLSQIIHVFTKSDDDAKIFIAKWDLKDGFWRMDCQAGEEYNFSYVLPCKRWECQLHSSSQPRCRWGELNHRHTSVQLLK